MKTRSQSKAPAAASVTTSTTSSPAPKSVVSRPSRKKSLANGSGNSASSQENQVITSLDENVSVTSSSPQEDQIAARAYQIWLENGQRPGCDEENWHQARRELSSSTAPVG